MAKWTWGFHNEKDSYWRKVIKAKFGTSQFDRWFSPIAFASIHSPWVNIQRYGGLIISNIRNCIGDGKRTYFWHDPWQGNNCLNNDFPNLFTLAKTKEKCIANVWNQDSQCWNLCLRRNLKDEKINEWAEFSQRVPVFNPTIQMDKWFWKLENSGTFTTKSLLHSINGSIFGQEALIFKSIWDAPCPTVLSFRYKISHWPPLLGVTTSIQIQNQNH